MNDELTITTSLDQEVTSDVESELERVDLVIKQSLASKDEEIAFNLCLDYKGMIKKGGLALIKAVALMEENWDTYGIGDNFYDVAYVRIGVARHTVERYVKIWKLFSQVPEEHLENVKQLPIRSLIPVAHAVSQGYELEDKDWVEVTSDSSYANVATYIRDKVKGAEPRKSGLALWLDRKGSIWCKWMGEHYFVGSLEVDIMEEPIQKSIDRILTNSGILKS